MPCESGDSSAYFAERLNAATIVACEALQALERSGFSMSLLSGYTQRWWNAHKREDQQRRQREKHDAEQKLLRQQAASKLTAEERKALGIESN